MELFTHNGRTYQGSLKKTLKAYKNEKETMAAQYLISNVLHDADTYTFTEFLETNYKPTQL